MTREEKIQKALETSDYALIDQILEDPIDVVYLANVQRETFLLFNLARYKHKNYNNYMSDIQNVINNIAINDMSVKFTGGKDEGKNSLWFAAKHQQWDIVNKFMSLGANTNDESIFNGESVFWLLAKAGQWSTVGHQVRSGETYINNTPKIGDSAGKSVLQLAIEANETGVIIDLLEQPVSIRDTQIPYLLPIMINLWLQEQKGSPYHLGALSYDYFKSMIVARFRLNGITIDDQLLHKTILNITNDLIKIDGLLVYKYPEAPESKTDRSVLKTIYSGDIVSEIGRSFIDFSTTVNKGRTLIDSINSNLILNSPEANKIFYTQFAVLIEKYKEIVPAASRRVFNAFYGKIQEPRVNFNTLSAKFYEDLKDKLEEIYVSVINMPVENPIRVRALADLSDQLGVCGPGIFNSINIVHTYTRPYYIATWIANYRSLLVSDVSMKIKQERRTSQGWYIHVDAEVIMIAQKNGYAPLGGREQLK